MTKQIKNPYHVKLDNPLNKKLKLFRDDTKNPYHIKLKNPLKKKVKK